MAQTPIYALRYQVPGDAPDGAALGLNLASDVEDELVRIDADVAAVTGDVNDNVTRLVDRGTRASGSSSTTTEVGVLRLDNLALVAGRLYEFRSGALEVASSVANDYVAARLRYSSAGAATTASTLLKSVQSRITGAGGAEPDFVSVLYAPAGNETGSLLLSIARIAGTGNVTVSAGAELWVVDLGLDPGDHGVDV